MKQKRFLIIIFLFIYFIIQEIIFSLLTTKEIGNIILKIFFCFTISFVIDLICSFFNEKINKRICYTIIGVTTLIYIVYNIYFQLFGNVLSFTSILNAANQSVEFADNLLPRIIENWYQIILQCIPFIALYICGRKISFVMRKGREYVIPVLCIVISFIVTISYINITSKDNDIYSTKNLYYNINNPMENVKNFGLITTIRLDVQRKIFGFNEKNLYLYKNENGDNVVLDTSKYNIINIDFDSLINQEENEEIREVYEYLSKQSPSNKNEYTGIFEGKNLIVFVAESFSNLAIREDVTPTLYKMANQGFQFKNFYTPLFPVSTADGEYLVDTSLIPAEGIWSIENVDGKTFPYTYPNALEQFGYKSYAYHNYDYKYYKRDKYFKTMGYDIYLGEGNRLRKKNGFL